MHKAGSRKIVFRGTPEGIREYKERFYTRLEKMGYRSRNKSEGTLIVGYDLYEEQVEQQSLCSKLVDYYPVVLSKATHDSLKRAKVDTESFLYVPDLVLKELRRLAEAV